MKWITRERVKVDRVACPWLIKKFVDPQAEFLFVPADKVLEAWTELGLVTNALGSILFTDSAVSLSPRKFYRARSTR
jgi:hypothetical protein